MTDDACVHATVSGIVVTAQPEAKSCCFGAMTHTCNILAGGHCSCNSTKTPARLRMCVTRVCDVKIAKRASRQTKVVKEYRQAGTSLAYQLPNMRAKEVMTRGASRVHTVAALLICHKQTTRATYSASMLRH